MPMRDHHCGAVVPPALLADEKQRRLCLSDRHANCATFQLAAGRPGSAAARTDTKFEAPWPRDRRSSSRSSPANRPGGETVTRWSIVRTRPVVLDHPRVPSAVASVRNRNTARIAAGAAVAIVLLLVGVARLSSSSPAAFASGAASVSPSALAIAATASAVIDPVPSRSPDPTAAAGPASPRVATPAPTAAAPSTPSPTPAATTYQVRDGDTLYAIAAKFDTSVRHLQDLNRMGSSTLLHPGDELRVR